MDNFGMHDLLQRQIQGSCRLALPDGLQDLMYDISREVLRAQPADVYSFITDYLAALLVTRENLAVAATLCSDICENVCHLGLRSELLEIGLNEEDVDTVKQVLEEYFGNGQVKEGNLIMKLMKKTDIDEELLPEIQQAIRRAFLRYQANNTTLYESSSSDSDTDEVDRAARHTLRLYRRTRPSDNDMERASVRIQAAYRAYRLRRQKDSDGDKSKQQAKTYSRNIRFNILDSVESDACSVVYSSQGSNNNIETVYSPPDRATSYNSDISQMTSTSLQYTDDEDTASRGKFVSASSTSLAGSYIKLPKHEPYSDALKLNASVEIDENTEKENTTVDYIKFNDEKESQAKKSSFLKIKKSVGLETKKATSFHSVRDLIKDKIELIIKENDIEQPDDTAVEGECKNKNTPESSERNDHSVEASVTGDDNGSSEGNEEVMEEERADLLRNSSNSGDDEFFGKDDD